MSPLTKEEIEETALQYERARRLAKRVVDAEEQSAHPPLQALTLKELFSRPSPGYLVDQWIPELGLIETVGVPGALKSFFMCHLGLSIAAGRTDCFGYRIVRHGAVLYIAAEGAGAFQFRIRAWCYEHDVHPLTIPFRVIPVPVNLRDPSFQEELLAIVTEMHPILIIVDTLSRCTPGAEENSARDMGEVIAFCSELQKTSSCAIAFVHHPTKDDPKGGGRGSGVIFGAVDTEIRITRDDDEDVQDERLIEVTCAKQKDDLKPPPLNLVGCVVPVRDLQGREMAHESGRPITSLVLRLADHADAVEKAAEKVAAAEHATDLKVMQTMQDYPAATSQQKLRVHASLNLSVVADSVGRILRAGWAVKGKRGQPFVITDAGRQALETPF